MYNQLHACIYMSCKSFPRNTWHGKYLMLACSENFHLVNFTGLANYASIVFLTTVDLPIKSIILLIQGNCNVVYNNYIA